MPSGCVEIFMSKFSLGKREVNPPSLFYVTQWKKVRSTSLFAFVCKNAQIFNAPGGYYHHRQTILGVHEHLNINIPSNVIYIYIYISPVTLQTHTAFGTAVVLNHYRKHDTICPSQTRTTQRVVLQLLAINVHCPPICLK